MMQQTKNRIFFWVFVLLWCALILWNLLTPSAEFSEAENRYLKTFPRFTVTALINGKFMGDIDTFLNDQFAGRPFWVSGQSLIEYGLGKREINSVYIGKGALLGDIAAADANISDKNIAGINAFAERYQIPVYAMLVPSATTIQLQKLPAFANGWDECAYIAGAYAQLAAGVTPVSICDTLQAHSNEYIYYRTDHHWTSYGAYLSYRQLASAMGIEPREQKDFAVSTVSGAFCGTYQSKTGFPFVGSDTIELYQSGAAIDYEVFDGKVSKSYPSIFFDEYLAKKDKYSYFLGQVQPYATIRTRSDSGKKLIVFKDSYAHSLIPMLLADFSEIRLVDFRFLNSQDYGELLHLANYDEALFLYSTDVFSHQAGPSNLLDDNTVN